MNEIPAIFKSSEKPVQLATLKDVTPTAKWAEFTALIVQFNETTVPEARELLDLLHNNETDPSRRAVLHAGIGRCLIHEGDFINGPKTLGQAYQLTGESDGDARAFIIMEMVSFMGIIGQYDIALILLDHIPHLTQSAYMLKLANYYWAVLKTRKGEFDCISTLIKSAEYFKSINEMSTVAYHLKNIGNAYRKTGEFELAESYYSRALKLTETPDYQHIRSAVIHDLGMLHFHQKNDKKALEHLSEAAGIADSDFMRCIVTGNVGLVHARQKKWKPASISLQAAFDECLSKGYTFLIPSIGYQLAQCHEQLQNRELAYYFIEKGFEAATLLLSQHFPYTGYRKKLIECYTTLTKSKFINEYAFEDTPDLSFTLQKSLKEIRGMFQGSLLDLVMKDCKTVQNTSAKLEIGVRTFYDIRNRARSFYDGNPISFVKQFYNEHQTWNWAQLNGEFENQTFNFLYDEYGQNKKQLANVLEINYQHAVKLTAGINKNLTTSK